MLTFDERLHKLIRDGLEEDLGDGDHSTLCCIPANAKGKAVLKIKQDGILAGMQIAENIFHFEEKSAVFNPLKKDGDIMKAGETAFEVHAGIHAILKCERLVLNCMQRMSGIATLTKQYTDKLVGYKTRILDTRKTTPNFRLLEKEAVKIGGGHNHRMGLYDMIMLKDNHVDYAGGIVNAIEKAWDYAQKVKPGMKIEIETRNVEEVKLVVRTGKVDRIMLDNFDPPMLREALKLIPHTIETEASGGI